MTQTYTVATRSDAVVVCPSLRDAGLPKEEAIKHARSLASHGWGGGKVKIYHVAGDPPAEFEEVPDVR